MASASTSPAVVLRRLGLVDRERSPLHFFAIQAANRCSGFARIWHLYEAEPPRMPTPLMAGDACPFNFAELRKHLLEVVLVHIEGQVANKYLDHTGAPQRSLAVYRRRVRNST